MQNTKMIEGINYKVFDNFLKTEELKTLQDFFLTPSDMFWSYYPPVISSAAGYNKGDTQFKAHTFSHNFYITPRILSPYFDIISPILEKLNPLALTRVKVNMNPSTGKQHTFGMHTDILGPSFLSKNIKTAVFYVNTNNGGTIFSDGTLINSVENRIVVFDYNSMHAGMTCTDQPARVVININYVESS